MGKVKKEMNVSEVREALGILADVQMTTSPITVQIGYVDESNRVHNGALIIKECPSKAISYLQSCGYKVSMTKNGLHVDKY
jgi:hypothetical protein